VLNDRLAHDFRLHEMYAPPKKNVGDTTQGHMHTRMIDDSCVLQIAMSVKTTFATRTLNA